MAVDDNDVMYLADGFNVIFSIDNVSGLESGTILPDRTLDGAEVQSPDRLFFLEP